MSDIFVFLAQALFIVALPPALTSLLRLHTMVPLVVMQIFLGILMGPSGLGRLAPELYAGLFPPGSLTFLSHVSSLALFFFAVLTGIHLDAGFLKGSGRKLGMISVASMVVPLVLGALAGVAVCALYPFVMPENGSVLEFSIGVGICCGVTALPVLAAMLRELNLTQQRLGQFALALAAGNDGMLWILLAVFLSVVHAEGASAGNLLLMATLIAAYLALVFLLVRPVLAAVARRPAVSDGAKIIAVCATAMTSAAATEYLGLHFLLGAFIAGAIVPATWRKTLLAQLQPITVNVLIPFFFISTGLKVLVDFHAAGFAEITALVTVCAIVGKVVGTSIAARLTGESWSFSLKLGSLAQAKGLMELVVATILLDAHVVSKTMFAALILMALVSTALTLPLMRLASNRSTEPSTPAVPASIS